MVIGQDGSIKIGNWGEEGFSSTEGVNAVRQNGVLLLKDGELTSDALRQGDPDVWTYYINNHDDPDYNWRSGIGITENGDIIIADGELVTAETLMLAMRAAGVKNGMQLELHSPFVHTVVYDHDGKPIPKIFAGAETNPNVDLKTGKERDILCITRAQPAQTTG